MNRARVADLLFTTTVGAGLFFSPALPGIVIAALLRPQPSRLRWRKHHTLFALATAWAMLAILLRPAPVGPLAYFAYLWLVPFVLAAYKPDASTLRTFGLLISTLFILDLLFNLASIGTGRDLLGRTLDAREGLLSDARHGGLFAHSFYSGSISIAALVTFLDRRKPHALVFFALANLMVAGSWRLGVAAGVILLMARYWRVWHRRGHAWFIVLASIFVLVGVLATAGLIDLPFDGNLSNANRLYAWLVAIEKLDNSGLFGVGFPSTSGIEAMTFEAIDENLIAESWYLGTAITFGIPYTVLFFATLVSAFFGENFDRRSKQLALLMPLVFVDMVAGEFFLGVLIYTWMWLLISCTDARVRLPPPSQAAATAQAPAARIN